MFNINSIYKGSGNLIKSWSSKKFILIIITIQIILHIPFLSLPPLGQHTWRQVAGLSQARNYYEEQNDFFYPRLDIRIEKDDVGTIYKEFPLIYWLVGKSYSIFGFNHFNERVIQLLIGILLIIGSFKFARAIGLNEIQSRWYSFLFSFNPYFYYYSITMLPDFAAMAWFLWGMSFIIPEFGKKTLGKNYYLGILFITLAAVSKASWLFFGLTLAYLFIDKFIRERKFSVLLIGILSALFVLAAFGLQYWHQLNLYNLAPIERSSEGWMSYKSFPTDPKKILRILNQAFGNWLPQLYIGYAALPCFLVGIYKGFKNKKISTYTGRFWLAWAVSFLIYFLLFFTSFGHDGGYYFTPILPLVTLISAYGFYQLTKNEKWKKCILLLVFLIPILMVTRIAGRWIIYKQVPDELLYQNKEIQSYIPKNDRVIVFDDNGVIIYLYYLNRKGVSISSGSNKERIEELKNKGFKWIFTEKKPEELARLANSITLKGNVGEFYIYNLH